MGRLRDRLRSLFRKEKAPADQQPSPPEQQPEQEPVGSLAEMIQQRMRRVSESFLDNESLTDELDDSAAKELLDWGLDLGSRIAQGTANVENDDQADQAMYPRLRATRRLMRSVNRWVLSQQRGDMACSSEAFDQIVEQVRVIYGQAFEPPSEEQKTRFLQAQSEFVGSPLELIANLRQLFADRDDA